MLALILSICVKPSIYRKSAELEMDIPRHTPYLLYTAFWFCQYLSLPVLFLLGRLLFDPSLFADETVYMISISLFFFIFLFYYYYNSELFFCYDFIMIVCFLTFFDYFSLLSWLFDFSFGSLSGILLDSFYDFSVTLWTGFRFSFKYFTFEVFFLFLLIFSLF